MRLPLVRSLKATIDIDPVLERCDAMLEEARLRVEDGDPEGLLGSAVKEIEDARAEYLAGPRARVRLRVIPPWPFARMRGMLQEKGSDPEKMLQFERELVRWGIVECDLATDDGPLSVALEDLEQDGRKYKVASWDVVDTLEVSDLLEAVAMAVYRFNVFSEGDRKK